MSPIQEMPEEARNALRKAAEWRLLSLLLERPRPGWQEEIASLAQEVDDTWLHEAAVLSRTASEETYLALFGPGGSTSPREVAYAGMEDPGRLLADVISFYRAFAFMPQAEDPPDHVAVETSFVGYLALKEAYARAHENSDAVQVTQAAQDRFLEAHLDRLIRGLTEKLSDSGPAYLIKTIAALLRKVKRCLRLPC